MVGHTRLALALTALGLMGLQCRPVPDTAWVTEVEQSKLIQKREGPDAARQYLLQLSAAQLSTAQPKRKRVTPTGEYCRLRRIAELENRLGLWEEADRHWEECLRANRDENNGRTAAIIQVCRFNVLIKAHNIPKAEKCLADGRSYASKSHDTSLDPFILHDQGLLLLEAGHFEEALEPTKRSLQLFEKIGRHKEATNVRVTEAWLLYLMGRYDDAAEQYIAARKDATPDDQHLCLGHLGNIAGQHRDYAKAADYAHRASVIAKDVDRAYYVNWLVNEAAFLIELGDFTNAEKQNQEAITVAATLPNLQTREQAMVNQALITLAHGQAVLAIAQLEAVVQRANQNAATLDAYAELSRLYLKSGDAAQAHAAYQDGLHLVEVQRSGLQDIENKFSFEASAIRLSRKYIEALMLRGRSEEAFQAAEASRAVMLREGLNLPSTAESNFHLGAYRESAKRTGSAYLAYWIAPQCSYLWVITGNRFRWYPLPGEAELQSRVDRFQRLVQERQASDREGAELFRVLIGPAQEQLRSVRKIVVAPDGPLYGINLETLRQGSAQAPYWIEDVAVTTAPSLSVMLSGTGAPVPSRRVLLVGDAQEWNADFPQLLNSARELDGIEAHFPEENRTRLTKADATPYEYQREAQAGYRYIHFATHAAANRQAPLESAIILSQGNGVGKLTARQVLAAPVRAELVSISACRSAGGKTYAGEGLVGLAWAFLHSGAHAVVAGLWDVSDHSSPLIMDALYGGLADGRSAAEALRSAKLKLLQNPKYAHPYFWGPFLLYQGAGSK